MQQASFRVRFAENERQSPVHFRAFTADSYQSLKRRERKRVRNAEVTAHSIGFVEKGRGESQRADADTPSQCSGAGLDLHTELQSTAAELACLPNDGEAELAEVFPPRTLPWDRSSPGPLDLKSPGPDTRPGCAVHRLSIGDTPSASEDDVTPPSACVPDTFGSSGEDSIPCGTSRMAPADEIPLMQDGNAPTTHQWPAADALPANPDSLGNDSTLVTDLVQESCGSNVDTGKSRPQEPSGMPPLPAGKREAQPRWTKDKYELLHHLRKTADLPWDHVARYFPNTSQASLRRRFSEALTVGAGCEEKTPGSKRRRGRPRKCNRPPPTDVDPVAYKRPRNQPAWEVDRIVDRVREDGILYYKVKWEDTWEPAGNLQGCADTAIAEFEFRHLI